MDTTYDVLRIAIPALVTLVFAVAALFLGKQTLTQLRGFIWALVGIFRPYVNDPTDALIKYLARELGIPEDQVVALFKVFLDSLQPPQEVNISGDATAAKEFASELEKQMRRITPNQ